MNKKNTIKALYFFTICLLASPSALYAWVPPASKPVCGYCEKENGHETWCPSYKAQQSSRLADYVPVQALPFIPSPCPICQGTGRKHDFSCKIGKEVKNYHSASQQYDNANDVYARQNCANSMKESVNRINKYLAEAKSKVAEEEARRKDPLWISNDEWVKEDKNSILYHCRLGGYPPKFSYSTGKFRDGCDKKIEFNIKGACIALGKTAPNGAEDWHFVKSLGNVTMRPTILGHSSYVSLKAIDMVDQQYYLVKPKPISGTSDVYFLTPVDGSKILHMAKSFEPICKSVPMYKKDYTGESGTNKDLWFICEEDYYSFNGTYYFFDPKSGRRSECYEYIDRYGLGSSFSKCMVKVRRKGLYGIIIPCPERNYNDMVVVPLKYTLVKERFSSNTKLPFYIVNPDGKSNHFGAYDGNGKQVLQCIYTNGEVERRIDRKDFK